MKCLYITADRVGIQTGGGLVTHHESEALKTMGECEVLSGPVPGDPFEQDRHFRSVIQNNALPKNYYGELNLAHCYAGCLTESVAELQCLGVKVCYTAAAHDVAASRREHLALGIPYDYPHLTDPVLWERYLGGYKNADVLVCPSQHSADVMQEFFSSSNHRSHVADRRKPRIVIIPHGCELPKCDGCDYYRPGENVFTDEEGYEVHSEQCSTCNGTGIASIKPLPERFTVGYLGSCGSPDKGMIYLLQAWKTLNYKDGVLILGGRDSTSDYVRYLCERYGGGNIWLAGWQESADDFYGKLSLYVQASRTEGFGLEVLEAMASGRVAICSDGAGASDISTDKFPAGNITALVSKIDYYKMNRSILKEKGADSRRIASQYTWESIRKRYIEVWKSIL